MEIIKHPATLPRDIEEAIDRVYRRLEKDALRSGYETETFWDSLIQRIAPNCTIENLTDFDNYGKAHAFIIWLAEDVRLRAGNRVDSEQAVADLGVVHAINVEISAIAPYYWISFATRRKSDGIDGWHFAPDAQDSEQTKLANEIASEIAKEGYSPLDRDLANVIVADVESELREVGTCSVVHLLMGEG